MIAIWVIGLLFLVGGLYIFVVTFGPRKHSTLNKWLMTRYANWMEARPHRYSRLDVERAKYGTKDHTEWRPLEKWSVRLLGLIFMIVSTTLATWAIVGWE
jgi:hypothetical protein